MDEAALGTRQERKERTRQAILHAALDLSAPTGLSGVSLRQVAKDVGIVPTAFYRHFDSIEQLGMVLVDDSFVSLRAMLRDVRTSATLDGVIPNSVQVLLEHVRAQQGHFGFIARERTVGPPLVRQAIRHELELAERELATDLARIPGTEAWSGEDLRIISELIVATMVSTAEKILDAPHRPEAEEAICQVARTKLRILVVGAANWRSKD